MSGVEASYVEESGGGGETEVGDEELEDNEEMDSNIVEVVVPQSLPASATAISSGEAKIGDSTEKKKDLKYYIVEVKEGDSLAEVVKKARLAAGSDKVTTVTKKLSEESMQQQQTVKEDVVESETVIEEVTEYMPQWQTVKQEKTDVGGGGSTVKLQIQLLPPSSTSPSSSQVSSVSLIQESPPQPQTPIQPTRTRIVQAAVNSRTRIIPATAPVTSASPIPPLNKNLTPEMLQQRIAELINKNQAIVNTPMADAPRPKRMSRQQSENLQLRAVASGSVPLTPGSVTTPASGSILSATGSAANTPSLLSPKTRQLFLQGIKSPLILVLCHSCANICSHDLVFMLVFIFYLPSAHAYIFHLYIISTQSL